MWWKLRVPGIEVHMAKYDVASAYKLLWLMVRYACVFATELPGDEVGIDGFVLIISLSLVFGFNGAPGEYMAFAWVNKMIYQAAAPTQPRYGTSRYPSGVKH